MTRDDFATLWKMLTGVWPRLDTPETVAAWWGLVGNYPAHHATASVRRWATDRRNPPTPADIIDGIKVIAAETRQTAPRAITGPACDDCDGAGMVWVSFDGQGTVRRCRRGCLPPTDTRLDHGDPGRRVAPTEWVRRLDADREQRAARRAQIGEHAYLRENGYDPERYRMSHGMIVSRPVSPRSPAR